MNEKCDPKNPSPVPGEVAARSAAGEGPRGAVLLGVDRCRFPSPGRTLRARPTSPARGEGKNAIAGEGKNALADGGKNALADGERVRRARVLRSQMTEAERKLWYALRDRRFSGSKFRRQVPIGRFIVDFVCFEARLVIEVDGGQHAEDVRDRYRDRWFTANGFRVLRFWNNEVLSNIEGVATVLAQALAAERAS